MPRSLFLKIFLWFGTVVVTVIVSTFLVGELMRPESSRTPMRRPMNLAVGLYAQTAAEIYERDGQSALLGYMDRVQSEANIRVFLFNSQLKELSGRRLPGGALDVAQRAFETRLPEFSPSGSAHLLARSAVTPGGAEYVLVAEMPPRLPQPRWYDHAWHVLFMALIGATFCYWLAKHLTSPVAKLRTATQELARGNLSARVVPALGNRRDELASLGADFDVMAEKIEALINSQRRLLGDISHELRSPLARLTVALELARRRAGPEATSALERIEREAENLNEMIGQLLALTRLESGAEEAKRTEFDLAELIREIVNDADFEARSRSRSVELENIERCTIMGTEQLLRRAVENVIRNAVQFTSEGTAVEVQLRLESAIKCGHLGTGQQRDDATPEIEQRGECAIITVRDHGAGVPEVALAEIFRPFYRVDDARDREVGGVGLGLAIAERSVRLHGGSIKATGAEGGGLIVTIILPIK